jgi:hypothetical protein
VNKLKELEEIKLANTITSFKFKTYRSLAILKDLTSRQMVMKIFDYLENTVMFQLINRRFYCGIHPHWFSLIKSVQLQTRLSEVTGISHPNLTDFEFPSLAYIQGLTGA